MTTAIVGILASFCLQGQSLVDSEKIEAWQAKYPSIDFLRTCKPLTRPNPTATEVEQCDKKATEFLAKVDHPTGAIEAFAYSTLGWIAMQRKSWEQAESAFEQSLVLDPNDGQIAYFLGTAIASEKKVDRIPLALFYFARAAILEGQEALPTNERQVTLEYVKKQFRNFYGSEDGFSSLLQAARSPTPPSVLDLREHGGDVFPVQDDNVDPALALWRNLKRALMAPDGQDYFNAGMKGAVLPTLKGKVARLEPETNPRTILLSMEDGASPEVTLKLDVPLEGTVAAGTVLSFEGVGESFTPSPFMVVFGVDRDHLHR